MTRTGRASGVERFDAASVPGPVAISAVVPNRGRPGTTVQIFGKGFSALPSQNSVAFTNGATATVTAATPVRLTTSVPSGATSGPITLTTLLGSAASPAPFQVIGPITVSPSSASVARGGAQQFQALQDATPAGEVNWAASTGLLLFLL